MSSKKMRTPNWLILALAFLSALLMWYTVTVRDRLEVQLEVRLDYRGVPENMVVVDGLINKMSIRLRGPEALVRSITPQNLNQVVNLSKLKKGTNVIPLTPAEWDPAFRAFEIIEISPPKLTLEADNIVNRNVPVKPVLKSPLQGTALTVTDIAVGPPTVSLRGPESVVNAMGGVKVIIPLDPKASAGTHMQNLPLDVPNFVSANPPSVNVQYTITSGRKEVTLQRTIAVAAQDRRRYTITPPVVSLRVEVPESLARNSAYLNKAQLSVTPPPMTPGSSVRAPISLSLPEGMTVLEAPPTYATVTKNKK